mgnify:FL=1|tara:strand:+ start:606 stop:1112 length:507 start_codon:yes stop_codon:yes gene_type:complete
MIKIIDNFFSKKDLKLIQDFALTKAFYTPKFFENTTEKNKKNHYGNRWELQNEPELLKLFKKQSELKFKIKINNINSTSGIDQRNLDHFKPHVDDSIAVLNILIMISGPTAVTNGTVFYTDGELDLHVGFRENRAIMFPSNKVHSPHVSDTPSLKRYSASLFIEDYEE